MAEGTERRLAAIVAADVAGWSRLVEQDEEGTLAALRSHRAVVIEPLLAEHRGRLANTAGDSLLMEFPSAVEAVRCMVAVQEGVTGRNQTIEPERRVVFRVGINVGDVVAEGDDLLGDGVNVAARVEELAEPGGIAISDDAYRQVRDRLDMVFQDGGEHDLKNISRPMQVWLWSSETGPDLPLTRAEVGQLTLPDKPAIAVLPFDNMSNDPSEEYFSDGIAEDLTTALSRFEWLFVIARNSAFSFKGRQVDVRRIGRELGVRYVLEGSVRRAGPRVRVNAQLIDAVADRHIWAERFDGLMDDIFALQDDIVAAIAGVVGPEISAAEIERTRTKRPETLDAWELYLRSRAAYGRMTETDMADAVGYLTRAIEHEPDFAAAHAQLALCHVQIGVYGWTRPVSTAFREARARAETAVRLAPGMPEANHAMAFVLMATGEAEAAVHAARYALERNPNYVEAHATLGHALVCCGEFEAGLEALRRALRGNPRDTRGTWLYDGFGHAYFLMGDYEKSIEVSIKGRQQDPSLIGALLNLACSHACLGNADRARHYVDELLRLVPRYSLRALAKNPMFVRPEDVARLVDSMRRAGLPE